VYLSSCLIGPLIQFVNKRKCINFRWSVGKKTALLQAEASACVSGLANVLFCAWAVHLSFFLTAKLPLSFLF
jgi:hypothetical protein